MVFIVPQPASAMLTKHAIDRLIIGVSKAHTSDNDCTGGCSTGLLQEPNVHQISCSELRDDIPKNDDFNAIGFGFSP